MIYFSDRRDAGRHIAHALASYADAQETLVLALPRGGVPVAFEIAHALRLPLDLMLVRKLGVPDQEELAMGAVAHGGTQILNQDIIHRLSIPEKAIAWTIAHEEKELKRRNHVYRNDLPSPSVKGKTVILVDDGMATGANMRAAVAATRKQHAKRIVVAVPVSSAPAYDLLKHEADEVVSIHTPEPFYSVGGFYTDFGQLDDQDVTDLLKEAEYLISRTQAVGENACERA